mmetsp:Transcript_35473/g.109019  ORF Transcript_35473/g.109019 Transcript_35473/m.109019 type:complete len:245 (-) Transcript_35473:691-1425(-)
MTPAGARRPGPSSRASGLVPLRPARPLQPVPAQWPSPPCVPLWTWSTLPNTACSTSCRHPGPQARCRSCRACGSDRSLCRATKPVLLFAEPLACSCHPRTQDPQAPRPSALRARMGSLMLARLHYHLRPAGPRQPRHGPEAAAAPRAAAGEPLRVPRGAAPPQPAQSRQTPDTTPGPRLCARPGPARPATARGLAPGQAGPRPRPPQGAPPSRRPPAPNRRRRPAAPPSGRRPAPRPGLVGSSE